MAKAQILVETTRSQKDALTSVLEENGATLTEWITDNIAEATADYSVGPMVGPPDLSSLADLEKDDWVMAALNNVAWAFADDDTTYLSHDIHPYPAKFIPQIPRHVIAQLSMPGETVWDPFGGSGTTALECVLLGRQAVSSDVNPLAEVIGNGKILTLRKEDEDFLSGIIEELEIIAASEASIIDAFRRFEPLNRFEPEMPNCAQWFHPQAVAELSYLRARIETFSADKCQRLATVCLSKIILRSSYQDSETRYTRCARDFPPGKVIRLFAGALESSLKKIRYLGTFLRFREAIFRTADLRKEAVVAPSSIDLIVTSPPYPNATDYHLYHRFRLFWLGFDPRELGKKEIGSHLRHQKEGNGIEQYLAEMELCLRRMFAALRPGRFAVMVIGDAMFSGEMFHTAGLVGERASAVGFSVLGEIERQLPQHRRSFVSAARRLRSESLLVLRKPAEQVHARVYPPPYRLWPYEAAIRTKEIEQLLGVEPSGGPNDILTARISPLQIDRLRRLTFSHSFDAPNIHKESTWQAVLENGDALKAATRKDPKYVTHGIHAYKGKFYPQLARSLFNLAGLSPGQQVLDPFCGSGTVPLEAYLNGMQGIGFDMNPLAVKIARAKSDILLVDPHLRDRLLARFQECVEDLTPSEDESVFPVMAVSEIESWFAKKVRHKLAALLHAIRAVPEIRVKEYLEVLLSNILREVSQQDPEDLRIRRRTPQLGDAPVFELYSDHLLEQRKRLSEFAARSNRAPCRFGGVHIYESDSRQSLSLDRAGLTAGSVDAVVTSPPYATALPYIDTDRLSILVLDGRPPNGRSQIEESLTGSREIRTAMRRDLEGSIENEDFSDIPSQSAQRIISKVYRLNKKADVGFRRKNMGSLLFRYFADMTKVFQTVDKALKARGSAFFVIGDTMTVAGGIQVPIKSADVLAETALALGWTVRERIPITVTTDKRPHTRNSIKDNDIIWCETA
ncbi:MAG TPA: DNA methyltransferase [Pyrinomonadaceae bacterium]|nr:DNA methyltransferase [Pyrinomonadaceae bacterium]